MKTWKQCCEEVGYDPYESNPPEKITKYYAYKNGAVFHVKTLEEAKGISKNYEVVVCNQDEIDAYWNSRRDLENKAQVIWYNSLLEEYSYLPKGVVEKCYSYAYDEGHSSGYDEVANCMYNYIELAEFVINFKDGFRSQPLRKE
jgi:hypothetical protein